MPPFLTEIYYGNPLWRWLLVPVVIALVVALVYLLRGFIAGRLRKMAQASQTRVDDLIANLISRTSLLLVLLIAFSASSLVVDLPQLASRWTGALAVAGLLLQFGLWGTILLEYGIRAYVSRDGEDEGDRGAITTLTFIGNLLLWTIVVLLAVENLPNVQLTSLIAGLGIGGIAVALAVQNILSDLFASLSILLDKPFQVGHFIVVGDYAGTVTDIGLKSTRVRSLTGEQLVFANSDLLNSRIRNYKRMSERRIEFEFGVLYETQAELLAQIPAMVQEVIEEQPDLRFDRAHLFKFGPSALVFQVVYFISDPDYNIYMDRQQAINLGLIGRFGREGIGFAYPTQTLYISDVSENSAATTVT